ncbi:MAG: hypothetical protein ACYC7H_11475, partial [Chloroflexota bacterium]
MRIDAKMEVGGFPAVAVRDFLRRMGGLDWTAETMAQALRTTDEQAAVLIETLVAEGYVEAARPDL